MTIKTDELRTTLLSKVISPAQLASEYPLTQDAADYLVAQRREVEAIIADEDQRLLVIIGPCSIHDTKAALEYAERLSALHHELKDDLCILMRVYFEKPRTIVGWKGLISDPDLDGSFSPNKGLRLARELLQQITELKLPIATEFLDMVNGQYIADLITWGAIGARTTESQIHREMASALSCPVGFKNGTDGTIKVAIDAIGAANAPHHFLSVTKFGHSAIVSTKGNPDCHIILRGGRTPNYSAEHVVDIAQQLTKSELLDNIMIDFSHANSSKDYKKQMMVAEDVAGQISQGNYAIFGVMVESHLVEGRQDLIEGSALCYGQSITDACIGWDDTETLLATLNQSVLNRRKA